MTTIIEDFLRKLQANAFVTAQFLIDLRYVMPNSIIIRFDNSKYAEMQFTTPKV